MAASLNKVFMMGNLTRDPEIRQAGGQQICSFGIAMSRTYQSARGETREDVCYVDVDAWGRTGEIVAQYARKGSPLFVEGRLRYDTWDDRETGKKRNRLTVTAENVQLLGGPRDNNGMAPQGGYAEDMPGGQRPYYQQRTGPRSAAAVWPRSRERRLLPAASARRRSGVWPARPRSGVQSAAARRNASRAAAAPAGRRSGDARLPASCRGRCRHSVLVVWFEEMKQSFFSRRESSGWNRKHKEKKE